jgi:hypothetical protein
MGRPLLLLEAFGRLTDVRMNKYSESAVENMSTPLIPNP